MNLVRVISKTAAETIWPTRCVICDEQGSLLCEKCISKINFIDLQKACKTCGEPYGLSQCCGCSPVHANLPEDKRDSYRMEFDRCLSATILDGNSGRIVTVYKDAGERRLGQLMAYFISKYVPVEIKKNNYIVTYIPATKDAVMRRGFDHAKELAQIVAKCLNKPCVCLFNQPETKDQRTLTRQMRTKNMKETFVVNEKISKLSKNTLNSWNILLIDDVLTTGATLNAASKALHDIGFNKIVCMTFARTY